MVKASIVSVEALRQLLLKRFFQSRLRLIVRVVHVRAREHGAVLSQRVVAFTGEIQRPRGVEMGHCCQSLLRALGIGRGQKFFRRMFVLPGSHQRFAVFEVN